MLTGRNGNREQIQMKKEATWEPLADCRGRKNMTDSFAKVLAVLQKCCRQSYKACGGRKVEVGGCALHHHYSLDPMFQTFVLLFNNVHISKSYTQVS